MYLLTIFLPFFSSVIAGFGGRWLGFYGASLITTITIFISFILSLFILIEVSLNQLSIYISIFPWFESKEVMVHWGMLFDNVTSVMILIVTLISFLVHLYSIEYMKTDPHFPRFISLLSVFTFFMLILITADNLVQLFVGWEGVGLASYLLINFWFTRLAANKAALKALIVNRIGDFGLLVAIFLIFFLFGSVNFITIFSTTPLFSNYYLHYFGFKVHFISLIGSFLIIGAVGKSAQLGLHTWLPDAMEGPTPVSALIHAATMVTAGVFLIIRFSPLIEFSYFTLNLLVIIGSVTAFFAAFVGTFQHDLKKVIAYSTCSQLGYMVFCCGLSCYNVSLFHLSNHAFFKALLFLSAGAIIHSVSNEQDMRRMGSLIFFLPLTYSVMLIGSLALVGFPFLTGFYSKDTILEISNVYRNVNIFQSINVLACWLGTLATFFTAFYSTRLIFLTFLNNYNHSRKYSTLISESLSLIFLPLIILALGSLFVGYFTKEFYLGMGIDNWNNSIFTWPNNTYLIESEFLSPKLKWIPFLFTISGVVFAASLNLLVIKTLKWLTKYNCLFFHLINKKCHFDLVYNKLIVYPLLDFGYFVSFKSLDKGFIELFGPIGLPSVVKKLSLILISIQTGQLTHYVFFMITSLWVVTCLLIFNFTTSQYELTIIFFILLFFV